MEEYKIEKARINVAREFHKQMEKDSSDTAKLAQILQDKERIINLDSKIIEKYQ